MDYETTCSFFHFAYTILSITLTRSNLMKTTLKKLKTLTIVILSALFLTTIATFPTIVRAASTVLYYSTHDATNPVVTPPIPCPDYYDWH